MAGAGIGISINYDKGYWLEYLKARTGRESYPEQILAEAVAKAGRQLKTDLTESAMAYYTVDALSMSTNLRRDGYGRTTLRFRSDQGISISHFNVTAVGTYRGSIPAYIRAEIIRGSGGGMVAGDGGKAFRSEGLGGGVPVFSRDSRTRKPVSKHFGPSAVEMINGRYENDKTLDPQQLLAEHIQAAVDKLLEG